MQQELNQRLQTAEFQLERHQDELVQGFTERIQQGKDELQGSRRVETWLRSELSQQQRSERATSPEIGWTQAEEQKNAQQARVARDEQLAQELRSAEQRMAKETVKAKNEVKELTQLTQSERRQAEEARRESRRSQLCDKVVQQAGEIHDLEFRLGTAKAKAERRTESLSARSRCGAATSARIACANYTTVADVTRQ